jgi:hypothetical protein
MSPPRALPVGRLDAELRSTYSSAGPTLAILALALAACGDDSLPDCPPSALTYQTFGEPFLVNWCRGCHSRDLPPEMRQGAPETVNFNDRRDVRQFAGRISSVVSAQSMPPAGGPGEQERGLLTEWIRCGAP